MAIERSQQETPPPKQPTKPMMVPRSVSSFVDRSTHRAVTFAEKEHNNITTTPTRVQLKSHPVFSYIPPEKLPPSLRHSSLVRGVVSEEEELDDEEEDDERQREFQVNLGGHARRRVSAQRRRRREEDGEEGKVKLNASQKDTADRIARLTAAAKTERMRRQRQMLDIRHNDPDDALVPSYLADIPYISPLGKRKRGVEGGGAMKSLRDTSSDVDIQPPAAKRVLREGVTQVVAVREVSCVGCTKVIPLEHRSARCCFSCGLWLARDL